MQVQNAQQKTDQALQTLDAAITADPSNALCKFHRASIFFAVGRLKEALQELEELKEIVPSESLVYYLTGKVRSVGWNLELHNIGKRDKGTRKVFNFKHLT